MQLFDSRTRIHRAKERILTVPFIEITSLKGWRPSRVKKRQVGKMSSRCAHVSRVREQETLIRHYVSAVRAMSPAAWAMGHYLEGHSASPRVMIPATRTFHQTACSGAYGFRSHRLRSLLMLCKHCRIRKKLVLRFICRGKEELSTLKLGWKDN